MKSRGPAVRGPRTHSDRKLYKQYMLKALKNQPNLSIIYDPVERFIFKAKNSIEGVILNQVKS